MAGDARPQWRRREAAALGAVLVGALCYALADWGGWPRLTFDPYGGGWSWRRGATPTIPINFYGGLLWAVGGAAVGAVAGLVAERAGALRTATARNLLTAWALTAVAVAGAYFWWNLWPL